MQNQIRKISESGFAPFCETMGTAVQIKLRCTPSPLKIDFSSKF